MTRQAMRPAPPAAIGRTASLLHLGDRVQRDADESPGYTGHLHATNQRTASARQDANGAHWRMTIMK